MRTYEEIAEKNNMPSGMRFRFIMYMRQRWASQETIQCLTGYAQEWAQRFLNESEYMASDTTGQAILKLIDGRR